MKCTLGDGPTTCRCCILDLGNVWQTANASCCLAYKQMHTCKPLHCTCIIHIHMFRNSRAMQNCTRTNQISQVSDTCLHGKSELLSICTANVGLKKRLIWVGLDRSQSLFYFVPQDSHRQAGSSRVGVG